MARPHSRAEFSRNLALFSVLAHLAVIAVIVFFLVSRGDPFFLDLLLIVVPVTAAYFLAALTWLSVDDGRSDRRKISPQARIAIGAVVLAVFAVLLAVPIAKSTGDLAAETAKLTVGGVETVFGAALAMIAKEFFGARIAGSKPQGG
ncbi:hypothetical protein [Marivivens marinus]|uniref:hypothetical protein n=1 Tax=Marivivens marinus TaxID=3110173 RepID=UPI003B849D51